MTREISIHFAGSLLACAGTRAFRRRPSDRSSEEDVPRVSRRHLPAHAPENHTHPSRHARYVVARSTRAPPRVPRPVRGATRAPGRRRSRSRACLFQRTRIHMWIATRRPRASPPSTERSCADIPSRIPSRSWHHRREERDDRAGGRRLPGRRAGAGDARCDFVAVHHRSRV